MKDTWDKLKIGSEVIKNNWPLLILAFTALSSMATNASQYMAYEEEVLASQKQVANVAKHLTKTVVIEKQVIDCKKCIQSHEKEYH